MCTNDDRDLFFNMIYSQYYKKLENICLQRVQYKDEYRGIIDESLQETFLVAVRQYETLVNHPAVEGWLVKTCYHRFTTATRTYQRRKMQHAYSIDDELHDVTADEMVSEIDEWMEQEIEDAYIERIIGALNVRESQVFHEYFVEQKGVSTIAQNHHSTVSAVKSLIVRIRRKARDIMKSGFLFIFR